MDQATLLVLAFTLFGLGTANGLVLAYWDSKKIFERYNDKLDEAIELKFESDRKIDELEDEIQRLREENQKLSEFKSELVSLVHRNLPPPQGMERSEHYIDESDSESLPDINSPLSG